MNALEKIMARAAGKESVAAGEIVDAVVDRIMITERQAPRVLDNLQSLGVGNSGWQKKRW